MEFVYAIRRRDLFDLQFPQGFYSRDDDTSDVFSYRERAIADGFFIQREEAEQTSDLKQIIPYLVIHHNGRILEVERLEEQSEERLHSLFSIGLGGHLNPEDTRNEDRSLLNAGMHRELNEELRFDPPYEVEFTGIVNDDANDVGSVHFGLVYRVDVSDPDTKIRETDNMRGHFRSTDELARRAKNMSDQFESWSRMILDDLQAVMRDS